MIVMENTLKQHRVLKLDRVDFVFTLSPFLVDKTVKY